MDSLVEINTIIDEVTEYFNTFNKKFTFLGKYNGVKCTFIYYEKNFIKLTKNELIYKIEKNDIVFGFAIETDTNEYTFQQLPLIKINNSKSIVSTFIRFNLKQPSDRFINQYQILEELAQQKNEIEIKHKKKNKLPIDNQLDDEDLTVKYIDERVCDFILNNNKNALNISKLLDVLDSNVEMFYKKWYDNRLIRKIKLLGIYQDEIKNSNMNVLEFYDYLFNKPWYIYTIDNNKMLNILKITLNPNMPDYEERECSKIARKLYRLTSSSTCALINNVTRNYSHYEEVLKNKWNIVKKKIKNNKDEMITYLYFKHIYDMEMYVFKALDKLIIKTANNYKDPEIENNNVENKKISLTQRIENIDFSDDILVDEQKIAVKMCVNSSIIILTGGGGTGKSKTCEKIYNILVQNGKRVIGTAPTGIATANLAKFLGPDAICGNMDYLIAKGTDKFDIAIFDESSMITLECFYRWIKKFPNTKCIFVGDLQQLEPVGQGHLMLQLVKSKRVPIVKLIQNHRILKSIQINKEARKNGIIIDEKDQNNDSIILNNANFLVDGMRDKTKPITFNIGDGFSVIYNDSINILKAVINQFKDSGIDEQSLCIIYPYNDILKELNSIPQEIYRPNNKFYIHYGKKFVVGDRVMYLETKNKYKLFNGSEGIINDITDTYCYIIINEVKFLFKWNKDKYLDDEDQLNMSDITHSFAGTVHKNQGLSRPFVITYLPDRRDKEGNKITMMDIKYMYTAITRSISGVLIIGDKEIIDMATSKLNKPTIENLGNMLKSNKQDIENIMNLYTNPPYKSEIIIDEDSEDDDDDYFSD